MDLWEQNIAESRQAALDRARECDPDRLPVWPPIPRLEDEMQRTNETVWETEDGKRLLKRTPVGEFNVLASLCDRDELAELRDAINDALEDPLHLSEIASQHSADPVLANFEQGVRDGIAKALQEPGQCTPQ